MGCRPSERATSARESCDIAGEPCFDIISCAEQAHVTFSLRYCVGRAFREGRRTPLVPSVSRAYIRGCMLQCMPSSLGPLQDLQSHLSLEVSGSKLTFAWRSTKALRTTTSLDWPSADPGRPDHPPPPFPSGRSWFALLALLWGGGGLCVSEGLLTGCPTRREGAACCDACRPAAVTSGAAGPACPAAPRAGGRARGCWWRQSGDLKESSAPKQSRVRFVSHLAGKACSWG